MSRPPERLLRFVHFKACVKDYNMAEEKKEAFNIDKEEKFAEWYDTGR